MPKKFKVKLSGKHVTQPSGQMIPNPTIGFSPGPTVEFSTKEDFEMFLIAFAWLKIGNIRHEPVYEVEEVDDV